MLLRLLLLSFTLVCSGAYTQSPNILIAISDDQSFPHTSISGCKAIYTPGFDEVARSGILFENAIAGSPGCSPSRASLLTGRNTWQLKAAGTHASYFPSEYLSFPEILRAKGYHTGYTGKGWGPGNYQISGWTNNPAGPEWNDLRTTNDEGISDKDYTANFEAFLNAKNEDQPFCFWYGAHEPHRSFKDGIGTESGIDVDNIEVPGFLPDHPTIRSDIADYLWEIQHFDQHLLNMVELLKKRGEWENTIVIVTSDNGMAFPRAKANVYEYGIHVPMAISWPKGIKGGRTIEDLVSFTDIAPTILEATKISHPGTFPMTGKSLMNLFRSEGSGHLDSTRKYVFSARERHSSSRYHSLGYPQRAMRSDRYLYIRNFTPERWPAGTPEKYGEGNYPSVEAVVKKTLGSNDGGYHDIDACPTLDFLIAHQKEEAYQKYLQEAVALRPLEEIYDIQSDPACMYNLAEVSDFLEVKNELRKTFEDYLIKTKDARMMGSGDIWESYPRYSRLRAFPMPEWAANQAEMVVHPEWVQEYWQKEKSPVQPEVRSATQSTNLSISSKQPTDTTHAPNVIVIITDDQGYGDFGFQGNPIIQTPNIDVLASQSAVVDRYYVSPVCAPTRASLMTGRYNYRTRVVDTYIGRAMMDPEETTMAELLSGNGYGTGIFGKWHLGDTYPMRPIDQGFDVSVIHHGGGLAQPADPKENNDRYTDPVLFRNGQSFQAKGYCTDIYFQEAMDFMESQRQEAKPFFTYIATNAPHGPYHDVPEGLKRKYEVMNLEKIMIDKGKDPDQLRDRTASIFAMIENIDENVGKLINYLVDKDLFENTVIFFMVDNGPNSLRYVGPLRGMKSNVHEGGIRSPLLVHYPQQIKAQTFNKLLTAHIDILPTVLDITNTPLPSSLSLDGKSIWPVLAQSANVDEETTKLTDRYLFIQTHRGDVPQMYHHFAMIGSKWKLVHPTGFGNKAEDPENIPYELYDIQSDPGETNNLANSYPDTLDYLLKQYEQWFEDVSTTRPNNYTPPSIVIGHPSEDITVLTSQDRRRTYGEGWGKKGYWLLENYKTANFQIRVDIHDPYKGGLVSLIINKEKKESKKLTGGQTLDFSPLVLNKGPLTLEVEIEGDKDRYIDYQVIVSPK